MATTKRITCPACGKSVSITAKGELRKHGHQVRHGMHQPGAGCCYMSFEKPEDYRRLRLENAEAGLQAAMKAVTDARPGYAKSRAMKALEDWAREHTAAMEAV